MKNIFKFALVVAALVVAAIFLKKEKYSEDPQIAAVQHLAKRVTGQFPAGFDFRIAEKPTKDTTGIKDWFRLESEDDKILITANNANSLAVGFNHYLKYFCNLTVGWFKEEKVSLPGKLPQIDSPIEVNARIEDRFFLNYCTYGYTMPWWKWEDWEHFIDWMALNGINLPLAITGQESIWYKIWTELGLSDEQVRSYFTGPAHLPWHRMLNIDHWGGPLPKSWLDGQEALQKQIVAREREFNMKPVLPAFAGHVPNALSTVYPEAKIERMSDWAGFALEDYPYFLDPEDSLFPVIQKKFLEKEIELYGTDHIYGIDIFNEMIPKSWEPDYLARVSKGVYESLAAADKDAIWLQMTWLFYNERKYWFENDSDARVKAFLTSYPADKSILLDYYCERMEVWQKTQSYYGIPFIWCYLGNFGGNTYLAGNIEDINAKIENTFANAGSSFKGLGSTLEGFDCNPFMYQFIFEKAWDFDTHKNLEDYIKRLADRRIGKESELGRKAWSNLLGLIYVDRSVPGHSPLLNLRPSLGRSSSYHSSIRFTYQNEELLNVIKDLVAAEGSGAAYEFDLVNLTRQWLGNMFEARLAEYKEAYENKDKEQMQVLEKEMLGTFDTLEELLRSQSYFLVGKWIANARSWGASPEEADYFESNARNLLTTWGDRGNLLTDYADRTWAGLVSTYYKGRWELFFAAVNKAMEEGSEFDQKAFDESSKDFEYSWWKDRPGTFNSKPEGNSIDIVKKIIK
ncbi:MAG: alpha-N-acetylglucosaminidase [Bacteroidales bacterium]|nr:alpha-N-acetylglucosaminidase [Bacteroidales bacterium]